MTVRMATHCSPYMEEAAYLPAPDETSLFSWEAGDQHMRVVVDNSAGANPIPALYLYRVHAQEVVGVAFSGARWLEQWSALPGVAALQTATYELDVPAGWWLLAAAGHAGAVNQSIFLQVEVTSEVRQ